MGNHRGWWWTAWRGRAKNTARISRLGGNGDSGTQYFSLRTTRPGVRVPLAALTKDAVPLNSLSGMMRIMSLCRQIGQITPFRRRLPTARNAVSARTGRPKSEFSGIAKRPFSERNGPLCPPKYRLRRSRSRVARGRRTAIQALLACFLAACHIRQSSREHVFISSKGLAAKWHRSQQRSTGRPAVRVLRSTIGGYRSFAGPLDVFGGPRRTRTRNSVLKRHQLQHVRRRVQEGHVGRQHYWRLCLTLTVTHTPREG